MAGKPKHIPWNKAALCARAGLSLNETAEMCDVTAKTLRGAIRREHGMPAAEWMEKGRARGTGALKLAQYEAAIKGNVKMLIFLGRSRLGQDDRRTYQHHVTASEGAVGIYEAEPSGPSEPVVWLPNNHRDDAFYMSRNGKDNRQ